MIISCILVCKNYIYLLASSSLFVPFYFVYVKGYEWFLVKRLCSLFYSVKPLIPRGSLLEQVEEENLIGTTRSRFTCKMAVHFNISIYNAYIVNHKGRI